MHRIVSLMIFVAEQLENAIGAEFTSLPGEWYEQQMRIIQVLADK